MKVSLSKRNVESFKVLRNIDPGFRNLLFSIAMLFISSCSGQNGTAKQEFYPNDPYTFPKSSLDKWCQVEADSLVKIHRMEAADEDQYLLADGLFTGWACHTDPENIHKFRYTQFENGHLIRQIGYYSDGSLDHDFRMKDGKSIGKERMWMEDGHLYIDHNYSTPGVMHGIQRSWHSNHVLSRKAEFENGRLIYEEKFDNKGIRTKLTGQVPSKKE